jgi:hypothetical protein
VNPTLVRVAMATATIMLGHHVAVKALRDTAFLTSWPATALPLKTVGTAVLTGVVVPVFSRLMRPIRWTRPCKASAQSIRAFAAWRVNTSTRCCPCRCSNG